MTTGISGNEWVAVHRKHHAKCETADDPHSPQMLGICKVVFEGLELYTAQARNEETLRKSAMACRRTGSRDTSIRSTGTWA
jgi:stearoyl-CoA desaturase (delta-9 desaturase)